MMIKMITREIDILYCKLGSVLVQYVSSQNVRIDVRTVKFPEVILTLRLTIV